MDSHASKKDAGFSGDNLDKYDPILEADRIEGVEARAPWRFDAEGRLAAGQHRLSLAYETDCYSPVPHRNDPLNFSEFHVAFMGFRRGP